MTKTANLAIRRRAMAKHVLIARDNPGVYISFGDIAKRQQRAEALRDTPIERLTEAAQRYEALFEGFSKSIAQLYRDRVQAEPRVSFVDEMLASLEQQNADLPKVRTKLPKSLIDALGSDDDDD